MGLERHVPVLFLDLNGDDLSVARPSTFHGHHLNGSFGSDSDLADLSDLGVMGGGVGGESDSLPLAGYNSILPKEDGGQFYSLPLVRHLEQGDDVGVVAAWDSSIHDSVHLNRVTDANERVYLILKACVRLSHPSPLDVVLRKRVAINIYKKQSLISSLKKRMGRGDGVTNTGVVYEVRWPWP